MTSQYYELICESKKTFKAKNLILTPPLPQSLVLIENLSFEATQQPKLRTLRAIGYDRCITLILELAEPIEIGNDGIWKNCSEAVSGIYNQQEKGLESELPTLVVHASPELSLRLWDQENSQIEKSILAETLSCLDRRQIAFEVSKIHLHRWKYAEPKALYPEPYALLGQPQHECAVAGDAFQRASLGGAVASGEALALAMIKQGL